MSALKARPSLQQVVKFWMLTSEYLKHGETFCNFKCKARSINVTLTYQLDTDYEIHICSLEFPVFLFHCSPCGLHLAPEQQGILGRASFSVVLCLYFDHLDLNKNTAKQQISVCGRDTVAPAQQLLSHTHEVIYLSIIKTVSAW